MYLVSSIAGGATAKDGRGFVSRVAPDGAVLERAWIASGRGGVTLHAPKGLALAGERLAVADIDTVRWFERASGRPLGAAPVPGARFLNDVAALGDGSVAVSDSRRQTVHRVSPAGDVELLLEDPALGGPNGLVAADGGLWIAGTRSGALFRRGSDGRVERLAPDPPAGGLDGLVRLPDGRLVVSSWNAGAIFLRESDGSWRSVATGLDAPADLGFDETRGVLLVPLLREGALRRIPLPAAP